MAWRVGENQDDRVWSRNCFVLGSHMTGALKGEPDAGPPLEGKAPPYLLQPQLGPQPLVKMEHLQYIARVMGVMHDLF